MVCTVCVVCTVCSLCFRTTVVVWMHVKAVNTIWNWFSANEFWIHCLAGFRIPKVRFWSDITEPRLPLSFWNSAWVDFGHALGNVYSRTRKNFISGLFINFVEYNFRILIRNIHFESSIVLKLKRKLFSKNSLKIGSQNYLFRCYLILLLTCNFVSHRYLLLLHTEKKKRYERYDQFCPQSHAITEKASEHL